MINIFMYLVAHAHAKRAHARKGGRTQALRLVAPKPGARANHAEWMQNNCTFGLLLRANLRIPQKGITCLSRFALMFSSNAKSMPNYSQKNNIRKIVKSTLQNADNLHFFSK